MKKIIFLIISSTNEEIYLRMKAISEECYKKIKSEYNIEYFFVECRNQDEELTLVNNTIYIKGEENWDMIIVKTHKALLYINNNYNYDFIIRTNLSTFWNIKNVYQHISTLDETNIATGRVEYWDRTFMLGTHIILSRDICLKLCEFELVGEPDDVIISQFLLKFTELKQLPENHRRYPLEDNEHSIIPDDVTNILCFRVKSTINRLQIDTNLFKTLAKKIYNIDCDNL
jgi:hypothetical protein